jgi:hypothetical protein
LLRELDLSALIRRYQPTPQEGRQVFSLAADRRRLELPARCRTHSRDAALDGIYVLRTSLPAQRLDDAQTVRSYKRRAQVERAFRVLKSLELEIRPIHHRLAGRVRAHVLLCLLAYYVEWHMRRVLAPLLFADPQPPQPSSPVAPARRSEAAQAKARTKRAPDGLAIQSFPDCSRTWPRSLKIASSRSLRPLHPLRS